MAHRARQTKIRQSPSDRWLFLFYKFAPMREIGEITS